MSSKKIAIIGGGPAGFSAAISAAENGNFYKDLQIYVFEKSVPLKSVLYTGNGRCNLSNNIADFKELAASYPRGEKFLYSVFSRFGVRQTLEWFRAGGLKTYVQPDNRIFPVTDRAASVRELFLNKAAKYNVHIIKACVKDVSAVNDKFCVNTDSGEDIFDTLIISTGGKRNSYNGYEFAKKLGHKVTELKPSLTSLIPEEKWTKKLAGVSVRNSQIKSFFNKKKISDVIGDFIFTHKGIAGPAVFNTSSYSAFLDFSAKNPLVQEINFLPCDNNDELKEKFALKTEKSVSNVLKQYIPKSLAYKLLEASNIRPEEKFNSLNEKQKDAILQFLQKTRLNIISREKEGEIVTAGGVDLKEIKSGTMESKLVKSLYFCGEILNIDGLSGGFNLQMCWSTGYIAGLNSVTPAF